MYIFSPVFFMLLCSCLLTWLLFFPSNTDTFSALHYCNYFILRETFMVCFCSCYALLCFEQVQKDDMVPDLLILPRGTDLHDHPLIKNGSLFIQVWTLIAGDSFCIFICHLNQFILSALAGQGKFYGGRISGAQYRMGGEMHFCHECCCCWCCSCHLCHLCLIG